MSASAPRNALSPLTAPHRAAPPAVSAKRSANESSAHTSMRALSALTRSESTVSFVGCFGKFSSSWLMSLSLHPPVTSMVDSRQLPEVGRGTCGGSGGNADEVKAPLGRDVVGCVRAACGEAVITEEGQEDGRGGTGSGLVVVAAADGRDIAVVVAAVAADAVVTESHSDSAAAATRLNRAVAPGVAAEWPMMLFESTREDDQG